ncbi:hypothetical protein JCM10212_000119 [Sporobolomyces blumeae]
MPYVSVSESVELYYEQTPHVKSKPSLVLIAPSWTNTIALAPYVDAFKRDYNCTAIELASHGRSINRVEPEWDFFCGAVELAFAIEALNLPPSHIFAAGGPAFQVAVKTCLLFPDQVESLILVGVATFFAEPRNNEAFEEVDEVWFRPPTEEDFVEVLGAIGDFLFGDKRPGADDVRMRDWLLGTIARRFHPWAGRHVWMASWPNHRHPRLTPELLGKITKPILMIQGERDLAYPIEDIEEFSECFVSSEELQFVRVPDGPHLLALSHPQLVISHMASFLKRRSPTAPKPVSLSPSTALEIAAEIGSNPSVATRDPRDPLSYSLQSADELAESRTRLAEMIKGEKECMLVLPMCHEPQDWFEPVTAADRERKLRRWKWSTRHENAHHYTPSSRPLSQLTLSEGTRGGVTVEVDRSVAVDRDTHPLPPLPPQPQLPPLTVSPY